MSLLQIKNLSFDYQKQTILDAVSLSLELGKSYALIGPNGSGKSTLLKCLTGILEPQHGSIEINGYDFLKMEIEKRSSYISWIPSQIHSYIDWLVSDFLKQDLVSSGFIQKKFFAKDIEKLEKFSSEFEVSHLLNKRLSELSDGEKQRVSIVRGLQRNSKVYLFDEPSSYIDVPHKFYLCEYLGKKIHKINSSKIVIFSTHDIKMALPFIDEILFVNNTKVKKLTLSEFNQDVDIKRWLGKFLVQIL